MGIGFHADDEHGKEISTASSRAFRAFPGPRDRVSPQMSWPQNRADFDGR